MVITEKLKTVEEILAKSFPNNLRGYVYNIETLSKMLDMKKELEKIPEKNNSYFELQCVNAIIAMCIVTLNPNVSYYRVALVHVAKVVLMCENFVDHAWIINMIISLDSYFGK